MEKVIKGMTLSGEAKPTSQAGKDPIGQLIAGMDKTLGDMFDKEIKAGLMGSTSYHLAAGEGEHPTKNH